MSIKNSNPFRVGFIIGAVTGVLGYFLQLEPKSLPLVDAILNSLGYSLLLGVFIGFGFSAFVGRTKADAEPYTDKTDYSKYSKKHPPTTKPLDNDNET